MRLTLAEALYLLELITEKEGFGYSKHAKVGQLQAKLSIMVEVGRRLGDPQDRLVTDEERRNKK